MTEDEEILMDERTDVCSYAHDAIETLIKENTRLKEEVVLLKNMIKGFTDTYGKQRIR